MWTVYAIQDEGGRPYAGVSNQADNRLREHNAGKCEATRGRQWSTLFRLDFDSKSDALLVERWLKKGDTKRKRAHVLQMAQTQSRGVTAQAVLMAARKWREATIRENGAYRSVGSE